MTIPADGRVFDWKRKWPPFVCVLPCGDEARHELVRNVLPPRGVAFAVVIAVIVVVGHF